MFPNIHTYKRLQLFISLYIVHIGHVYAACDSMSKEGTARAKNRDAKLVATAYFKGFNRIYHTCSRCCKMPDFRLTGLLFHSV